MKRLSVVVVASALVASALVLITATSSGAETLNVPPVAQSIIGASTVSVPCPSSSCGATASSVGGDEANDVTPEVVSPKEVAAGPVLVKVPKASRSTYVAPANGSERANAANGLPCSSSETVPVTGGFKVDEVLQGCRAQQTSFQFVYKLPAHYRLVQTIAPGSVPLGAITGDNESVPIPAGTEAVIAITTASSAAGVTEANTYGFIDAPTAFDAIGQPVPTGYTITGPHTILQTIDWVAVLQDAAQNGDSVFPVTADPELTFGWCAYVYFSYQDISSVFFVAWVAGAPAAAVYICGPAFADPAVGLTCSFLVAAAFGIVADQFHQAQDRCPASGYNGNCGGIVWKIAYWGQPLGRIFVGSWS